MIHKLKKIQFRILPILFLLFLCACSAGEENTVPAEVSELENMTTIPADIQPTHDITIQKEKVFGDFERNTGAMGGIRDIAVDDSGRVFISDTQQKTIHMFSPDGQFIQNIGRSGSGPGEFRHIFPMKIQGDKLFAFDPTFYRLNFYSLESLTFDHVEELFFQDWSDIENIKKASPVKFYDWSNNNLLIGFDQVRGDNIYYYVVNNSGHRTEIISGPILVQKDEKQMEIDIVYLNGMEGSYEFPFGRESLIAVSEDRHIFTAWTEHFLIKEYNPEGTYLRAWYYPYKNLPLTQNELDSYAASRGDFEPIIQEAYTKNELPATRPALKDIRIDDQNRLWVSTVVKDLSVTEWWILEMDGTLLGRFTWPKQKQIEAIKNSCLYTKETDRETGIQEVVRYRVKMKKQY
ncbi:6-bladed beta-propeller protein [Fodinibius roseus]|uniref:6-bladed beta-propeller protein n=1 Tax=Fodinibius roseus TaxID=1194090 RepID=A0A1M4SDH2_9BACT|nr:6-bladed beta-propeller [Fodinibius roseus]SHE30283.1 6-bladed beta-propeller protein [Fodinibius roseus]